jgi:type I restriction enzyme S subunit
MGEELYELPKGWVWVTVEQISIKVTDGVHKTPNYVSSGIPFISVNNLSDRGLINFEQCKYITLEEHQELFKRCNPEIGDILLSKVGTVGLTAVINTKKDFSLFVNTALIKPVYNLASAKFFSLALRYGFWSSFYNSYISGSTQKFIGTKNISLLPVPLPPLIEQHRIVAKIEELFTELDAGVELLKKLKAKLKRYRQAVLKAAVEGNLTKEWREANQGKLEPAPVLLERILKQRRQKWEAEQLAKMKAKGKTPKDDSWKLKYKEPVAPDTSDLPELPDGWCWVSGDTIFEFVTSGSRGWAEYYSDSGALFLRMGNLEHDSINLDLTNTQRVQLPSSVEGRRSLLQGGDILISITADVGMIAIVPYEIEEAYINQHVALARPINEIIPHYIAWFLASKDGGQKQFISLQRGATKTGLGLDDIRRVSISLPPLYEQKAILEEIERVFSVIDQLEKTIDTNLKRAEKLRQSILKQAFEGKLVPQDPNDEPAEKLLERIKAEKAKIEAKKKPKRQPKNSTRKTQSKSVQLKLEFKND